MHDHVDHTDLFVNIITIVLSTFFYRK